MYMSVATQKKIWGTTKKIALYITVGTIVIGGVNIVAGYATHKMSKWSKK